jgi:hypothetical protein
MTDSAMVSNPILAIPTHTLDNSLPGLTTVIHYMRLKIMKNFFHVKNFSQTNLPSQHMLQYITFSSCYRERKTLFAPSKHYPIKLIATGAINVIILYKGRFSILPVKLEGINVC